MCEIVTAEGKAVNGRSDQRRHKVLWDSDIVVYAMMKPHHRHYYRVVFISAQHPRLAAPRPNNHSQEMPSNRLHDNELWYTIISHFLGIAIIINNTVLLFFSQFLAF